jgi:hypothetical protein
LTEDLQKDENGDDDAKFSAITRGVFVDPSVRFFGIDWEAVFGRCFSLSLNAKIFCDKIIDLPVVSAHGGELHQESLDLVLINRILRDLTLLEADVTSHAEAVLQGRLSRLNQMMIQKEQLKYASSPIEAPTTEHKTKLTKKVSRAQSFRDAIKNTVAGSPKTRHTARYRRNKTTHLDKLSTPPPTESPTAASHQTALQHHQSMQKKDEEQKKVQRRHSILKKEEEHKKQVSDIDDESSADVLFSELRKKKNSFLHNITAILKITGDTMK